MILSLNSHFLSTSKLVDSFKTRVVNNSRLANPDAKKKAFNRFKQELIETFSLTGDTAESLNQKRFFEPNYHLHKMVLSEILSVDEEVLSSEKRLSELIAHLDEAKHASLQETLPATSQEINEAFALRCTEYGYFNENNVAAQKLFYRMFESCRRIACLLEDNYIDDKMVFDYAFKLMALFIKQPFNIEDNEASLEKAFVDISNKTRKLMMSNLGNGKEKTIYHDTLIDLRIPNQADISDLAAWQHLINKDGAAWLSYFSEAKKIEAKIAEEGNGALRAPDDLAEAKDIYALCTYERAPENAEFAVLCHRHRVPEATFNAALDYMKDGWPKKTSDNLPSMVIEGTGDATDFIWLKLPFIDERT